jgi:hypothetical protein
MGPVTAVKEKFMDEAATSNKIDVLLKNRLIMIRRNIPNEASGTSSRYRWSARDHPPWARV